MGVNRIEGRLIGHDALFTTESIPDGWTADDLVWSYGAEVTALSAFDNSIALHLEPGELDGDPGRLTQSPETAFLRIENRTTTSAAGTEQNLTLTRALGSRTVTISGTLPRLGKVWNGEVAAPEPSLFATTLLAEALQRQGITLADSVSVSRAALPKDLRPIASIHGPGIEDQIRFINKDSQNLHAETLLRRLGLAVNGDASVASSLRARESFMKAQGVRFEGSAMYDGSGLSRGDLITVRSEVDLLMAMSKHRLAAAFRASLPIAGVDGTLKRRMVGTKAEGRVFAKTGSLSSVNALAGYIDAASGRRLAFADAPPQLRERFVKGSIVGSERVATAEVTDAHERGACGEAGEDGGPAHGRRSDCQPDVRGRGERTGAVPQLGLQALEDGAEDRQGVRPVAVDGGLHEIHDPVEVLMDRGS